MALTNPTLEKYVNKGRTGLRNIGNTCFLNSCIQVLNHSYELIEVLNSNKIKKHYRDIPDIRILLEWNELRELMWQNEGTISPNKFVFNVHSLAMDKGREMFTGYAQNDLTEFLLFMIECIHNSICRERKINIHGSIGTFQDEVAFECFSLLKTVFSKEYSEIVDLFYGITVNEIYSLDNRTRYKVNPAIFFMIDLPLPPFSSNEEQASIYDCFDLYIKDELMEGENAWLNEKTDQKEDIIKKIRFWKLPKILVVTLQRFSHDGERKIHNHISFPLDNLDLTKYTINYLNEPLLYECYGICNHFGNFSGGHYTSLVKNASNEWVHYNDDSLEKIEGDPADKIITPYAYCLFYRKKNSIV
jgi:ubiquitin carboxyl-terminal hydrolase 8